MKFKGAFIKEQGVTFAIVIVNPRIINGAGRERVRLKFSFFFRGVPVILAVSGSDGHIQYHGREDIVDFLAPLSVNQIPWKDFNVY